jgi:hypothetical protein
LLICHLLVGQYYAHINSILVFTVIPYCHTGYPSLKMIIPSRNLAGRGKDDMTWQFT